MAGDDERERENRPMSVCTCREKKKNDETAGRTNVNKKRGKWGNGQRRSAWRILGLDVRACEVD